MKKRGNILLYVPDEKTIREHIKKCGCYNGAKPPDAVELERELIRSQDAIHSVAKSNRQIAMQKINDVFSPHTEYKAYACNKCGYISKDKKVFRKHFASVQGIHTNVNRQLMHLVERLMSMRGNMALPALSTF